MDGYFGDLILYSSTNRIQLLLSCRGLSMSHWVADMFFYAVSTILKFGALIQLRLTEPDAFRPLWIPGPCIVLAVLVLIPIGFCISMVCFASENSQAIGLIGATAAIVSYIIKELFTQYGKKAEEVMQQRMAHFQQNIDRMQQRIDYVVSKEFKSPLEHLGQVFRTAADE
eukprot:c53851_g1_i1 orf=3-509(-)